MTDRDQLNALAIGEFRVLFRVLRGPSLPKPDLVSTAPR